MKKSVYSLVLMDRVIKAVDEQAYRLNTSRSNLINQILAEHLCCTTPEMRIREIFNSVTKSINNNFQVQQQGSAYLITFRTALSYKYRPAVNYKIELQREPDNFIGQLRVHIRTQNSCLIELFNDFFMRRVELEKRCLSEKEYDTYIYHISSGCFTRNLINVYGNDIGISISHYLNHLNKSMQLYFLSPKNFPESMTEMEYKELISEYLI